MGKAIRRTAVDARLTSRTPATIQPAAGPSPSLSRVTTDGKHLTTDSATFHVKGVTYGSFAPRLDGELFPDSFAMKNDLLDMADCGINTIRTYTLPPVELLDLTAEMGLKVLVGVDYEDWRYRLDVGRRTQREVLVAGRAAIGAAIDRCAGRPEVLAISVGNEVPVDVIRTHGITAVEDGLSELTEMVHEGAPHTLATYCNFPTTEFLDVEGQDIICFNVFLERPDDLKRYLNHLQMVAGDRPVVVTELGLASEIHGERMQAETLGWQLRTVSESGLAGATVFSWTDEWAVDGVRVDGWGFGLTDENRNPKPALQVMKEWATSGIRDLRAEWPSVSAIVCAYNAEQHIGRCIESLLASPYPGLEIVVCDDGSTDSTKAIANSYGVNVIDLPHRGLSRARNAGIAGSTGDIVAFIDSDAFCHPEWPYHLALSLEPEEVGATGGPNLPVRDADLYEEAVSRSPGGPREVLLSAERAEHVPGCNMAFRREALEAVAGFDESFRAAGDDVDVCWKTLEMGYAIAFSPAAQVRHHRRDSVRGYLKQQRGYGRAEKMLIPRHPHRFNRLGQARWSGFVYGPTAFLPKLLRPVVYHGVFGTEPYQPVARRPAESVRDWGTALAPLLVASALLELAAVPFSYWFGLIGAASIALLAAFIVGIGIGVEVPPRVDRPLAFRMLIGFLHVAQPCARVWGRIRTRAPTIERSPAAWNGNRQAWLTELERELAARGCRVRPGGITVPFDLEVWRHPIATVRVTTAVLWGWQPVHRVGLRIRWIAFGLLAAGGAALVLFATPQVTAIGLTVLAGIWVADAIRLRRTVVRALVDTSRAPEESR